MAKTNGAASNASGLNTTAPLGSLVTGSAGSMSGQRQDSPMVDEMFDGPGGQMDVVDSEDSVMTGPVSSLLSELTANERTVHADFYKNFGDLFDDKDLS
jgi:hypothetical protein